jgi:hypothetical protein
VNRLTHLFTSRLGDTIVLSVQNPSSIDDYSEPVPDVSLLKPRMDFYTKNHPLPEDVLLVIEISHTTAALRHQDQGSAICRGWNSGVLDFEHSAERARSPHGAGERSILASGNPQTRRRCLTAIVSWCYVSSRRNPGQLVPSAVLPASHNPRHGSDSVGARKWKPWECYLY